MKALYFIVVAICTLVIAYRYYSAFIAAKVLTLNNSSITPAHRFSDGNNYVPMHRWVLFGHHFAAITGAGPLIGPVLAAQFGFLPGYLWLIIGVVLGGAVHDFVILVASVRHDGKSIAEIAQIVMGPWAGRITVLAILFIVIVALAGLGLAVVNALEASPWGTFTLGSTIPVAVVMGIYMQVVKKGAGIREATVFGVVCLVLAVVFGEKIAHSQWASFFTLSRNQLIWAIAIYGFVASVLPVWLLLCPRDYLSSFMKLGTIGALTLGVLIVNPTLQMPLFSQFVDGGGPILPGKAFPFVFITIACGAISGFHSLIASGTTPKMVSKEPDCRVIGYGAMLCEGWVGLISLIAASALFPEDYFAINTSAEKFAQLGMSVVELPALSQQVGEAVAGRTGGAVSLAVGMAHIFSAIPGFSQWMSYWYHFAILFEALFILTTIDSGTRVARFLVQEIFGKIKTEWGNPNWLPGNLLATSSVVVLWATLILTGDISTIWPLFGIANELLAVIALVIASVWILHLGKRQYVWVTVLPLSFVAVTTTSAAVQSIFEKYWVLVQQGQLALGYFNLTAVIILMTAMWSMISIGLCRAWTSFRISPSSTI